MKKYLHLREYLIVKIFVTFNENQLLCWFENHNRYKLLNSKLTLVLVSITQFTIKDLSFGLHENKTYTVLGTDNSYR
jgi:hypothetical protein